MNRLREHFQPQNRNRNCEPIRIELGASRIPKPQLQRALKQSTLRQTCIALAVSQLVIAPVHSAIITVNSTADSGSACTLRKALVSINSSSLGQGCSATGTLGSSDQINFSLPTNSTITLLNGELLAQSPMTISGPGRNQLTIDANLQSPVFDIGNGNGIGPVTISGLTLMGGVSNESGAGVRITRFGSLVTISDSKISNNRTQSAFGSPSGGGIFVLSSSSLTLINSELSNNYAQGEGGGVSGFSPSGGCSINVINSTISNNTSMIAGGGANVNYCALDLSNSLVDSNTAPLGGGVNVANSDPDLPLENKGSILSAKDSTLSGNSSSVGGALLVSGRSFANLEDSTVSGNRGLTESASYGGGMHVKESASLYLKNVTVSDNSATSGGGVYVSGAGSFLSLHATISNNNASYGGGISLIGSSATISFLNTLISGNSASNSAAEFGNFGNSSSVTSLQSVWSHAGLNSVNSFANFTPDTSANKNLSSSAGSIPLNQILSSLASNGGPTNTHALTANSPAIGFASSNFAVTNDQRGVVRDAALDVGAFEYSEARDGTRCFSTKAANGNVITFCL